MLILIFVTVAGALGGVVLDGPFERETVEVAILDPTNDVVFGIITNMTSSENSVSGIMLSEVEEWIEESISAKVLLKKCAFRGYMMQ